MKHFAQIDARELAANFSSAKPFKHLVIPEFVNRDYCGELLGSLATQEFSAKESDLFKFHQTGELNESTDPILGEFRDTLYSEQFLRLMQQITGFSLSPKFDLHGTIYEDTNFLLVHDDKLEGRKIAFLLYLTDMEEGEGGSLDLYDCVDGKPTAISKTIIPKVGTLAFFEVSSISFHQVSEVVVDKQRIAIGGWFHA